MVVLLDCGRRCPMAQVLLSLSFKLAAGKMVLKMCRGFQL